MHAPAVIRKAVAALRRADPVLAGVIDRVGPPRIEWRDEGPPFDAILRSIVYQQLSGKAAATILGRVRDIYGPAGPTPAAILATPDETLRAAGLSRAKTAYVKDLAAHALDPTRAIERLGELSDDEVIDTLVAIKGVGRWTAQMVLMFRLGRLDVVPELDLGIRKAIQLAWKLRAMPSPQRVRELGAAWSPYGTIASWYLWRSLELPKPAGATKSASRTSTRKKRAAPKRAARSTDSASTRPPTRRTPR
jgi:3-methyladenine DNA glycosylase/8-oxoguanine DNA glycosylase